MPWRSSAPLRVASVSEFWCTTSAVIFSVINSPLICQGPLLERNHAASIGKLAPSNAKPSKTVLEIQGEGVAKANSQRFEPQTPPTRDARPQSVLLRRRAPVLPRFGRYDGTGLLPNSSYDFKVALKFFFSNDMSILSSRASQPNAKPKRSAEPFN